MARDGFSRVRIATRNNPHTQVMLIQHLVGRAVIVTKNVNAVLGVKHSEPQSEAVALQNILLSRT